MNVPVGNDAYEQVHYTIFASAHCQWSGSLLVSRQPRFEDAWSSQTRRAVDAALFSTHGELDQRRGVAKTGRTTRRHVA